MLSLHLRMCGQNGEYRLGNLWMRGFGEVRLLKRDGILRALFVYTQMEEM